MDIETQNSTKFKELFEFIRQDEFEAGKISPKWKRLESDYGDRFYSEILFLLTQREFEPAEAKTHWININEHRRGLSNSLGRDVGVRVALTDYFINIKPRLKEPVLVEIQLLMEKEKYILVDELTGIYNRRFFNVALKKEFETFKRRQNSFSLLMMDVDNFKEFNDVLGHQAGDAALSELARILVITARQVDHVARYGGEEFCVILPGSNKEQAQVAAERFRKAVDEHYFHGQDQLSSGNLTMTIGVASIPEDADDSINLIDVADQALYEGKATGRNRVMLSNANRRRHERYRMDSEVLLKVVKSLKEVDLVSGRSTNISQGGMLFQTDKPIESNEPVEIRITDKTGEAVSFPAEIAYITKTAGHADSYFMGISFKLKSPDEEQALTEIIQEYRNEHH